MRRIIGALMVLAVVAALMIVTSTSKHGVRRVYAGSGCSIATLKGNYGALFNGFSVDNNTSVPFYGEGLLTFDGAGNLSGTLNFSIAGQPTLTRTLRPTQ